MTGNWPLPVMWTSEAAFELRTSYGNEISTWPFCIKVQNLAYELAPARVLVVDLDPQSTLTIGCGLDPGVARSTVYGGVTPSPRASAS